MKRLQVDKIDRWDFNRHIIGIQQSNGEWGRHIRLEILAGKEVHTYYASVPEHILRIRIEPFYKWSSVEKFIDTYFL